MRAGRIKTGSGNYIWDIRVRTVWLFFFAHHKGNGEIHVRDHGPRMSEAPQDQDSLQSADSYQ